jgi:FtsZ-binding cell division protein ZapB
VHGDVYDLLQMEVNELDERKLLEVVDSDWAGVARRDRKDIEVAGMEYERYAYHERRPCL